MRDAASSHLREDEVEIKEKKVYSVTHALIQLSSRAQHIQSSFSFELSNDFNSSALAESCFTKVRF